MAYKNPIPKLKDEDGTIWGENEQDYTSSKEVYFAFIDVLGFKKTFDDIKISQNNDEAKKYRDVFNYYFSLMNSAKFMINNKKTDCYAGQTSDSLYFYTGRLDYLMQFIKIFSHFNLYAMSKNVFFRGGIAKGALYKKEKYQFYGDSVINAFLLENEISKNPIIMIDEQTHADMGAGIGEEYTDLVSDDKSGRHYINPFAIVQKDFSLDIEKDFQLKSIIIEKIEEIIEENKQAFEYHASNYLKYNFLLNELKEVKK